jgi:hypothetical protein
VSRDPDLKPWYASKGVVGSLFAAAGSVVVFWNSISPAGAEVPPEVADQINDQNTVTSFVAVGVFISAVVAWVGRLTASKSISKSPI